LSGEELERAVADARLVSIHDEELGRLMDDVCAVAEGAAPPLRLLVAIEGYVAGWGGLAEPPAWLGRMRAVVERARERRAAAAHGTAAFDLADTGARDGS